MAQVQRDRALTSEEVSVIKSLLYYDAFELEFDAIGKDNDTLKETEFKIKQNHSIINKLNRMEGELLCGN